MDKHGVIALGEISFIVVIYTALARSEAAAAAADVEVAHLSAETVPEKTAPPTRAATFSRRKGLDAAGMCLSERSPRRC